MKKGFVLGLLGAALGFYGYSWVKTHYVILPVEDMQALLLGVLAMYCPK